MEALIRLAVRRPVAVTMLFVAVLVAGYLSWGRLGIDLLPDVESPKIVVSLRSGDRSPEEMEERYGEQIEARLVTVRRMRSVTSVSRTGRILVTVEFHWGTDMDFALIDVQTEIGVRAEVVLDAAATAGDVDAGRDAARAIAVAGIADDPGVGGSLDAVAGVACRRAGLDGAARAERESIIAVTVGRRVADGAAGTAGKPVIVVGVGPAFAE